MSNIQVTITGDTITCNGKKAKHKPHKTNGRSIYITKEYVIKLDDRGYHHDDMSTWLQIEPEDQKYFVPCIAQGKTKDGIGWSVQPFVTINHTLRKTIEAESKFYDLVYKYDLHDMHDDNWVMSKSKGEPLIFDYGMS